MNVMVFWKVRFIKHGPTNLVLASVLDARAAIAVSPAQSQNPTGKPHWQQAGRFRPLATAEGVQVISNGTVALKVITSGKILRKR
jgi:hypothetical protein